MDRNGIIRANCVFIPDFFINLINRKNFSRVLHEKKQDVVLDGCQLDRLSVDGNFLVLIVDHQSAALVDLGAALLVQIAELGVAAELGFHAGYEF